MTKNEEEEKEAGDGDEDGEGEPKMTKKEQAQEAKMEKLRHAFQTIWLYLHIFFIYFISFLSKANAYNSIYLSLFRNL